MGKLSNNLDLAAKKSLTIKLNDIIDELKNIIMEEYDDKLTVNIKSKIDYNSYREKFVTRLNEFQFIEEGGNTIILNTPDMETFDFSDDLELIKTILEGTSGVYVEVNEKEYAHIFGRKPTLTMAVDRQAPPKNRMFLLRYTGNVRRAEKSLNKRFNKFPFSNTPPIDVLGPGDLFVKDNIDKWIDETIKSTVKETINKGYH
jgi:hypothetical protein